MNYCIIHEAFVPEKNIPFIDFEGCIITSCPPPEMDMSNEWIDSLIDPSENELIK